MKSVTPQSGMHLRVSTTFDGQERQKSFHKLEITIGRANGVAKPDLDLSPDVNVSRRHARVWMEEGQFWIEDFGSKFGTQVDGDPVYPGLKAGVKNDSVIQIGDTSLRIECSESDREISAETQFGIAPALEISHSINANVRGFELAKNASTDVMARQALLLDLPLEFSAPNCLDELVQIIVKRLVEAIPGAKRGTLLLKKEDSDALRIAAFVSEQEPVVSETLARRALTEQKGFIWRRGVEETAGQNGHRPRTESGMYAPLFCHGRALGVISVDNPHRDCAFSDDDLRLLLIIAHHAALSVLNRQLQDGLRENSMAVERLLPNFSPKLRTRLIDEAREGRLRVGGAKSSLSILHAELRCVTGNGRNSDAAARFEILTECFGPLTEAIFSFDGSLQKFGGEGIVAVFGSPEPDLVQHSKAIRAAWTMQRTICEVNALRAANGQMICELGIGLHCGEVVHGFVGTSDRFGFAVIGDAIDKAAQLSRSSGAGEIFVSDELYQRTSALIQVDEVFASTTEQGSATAYRIKSLNS